MFVNWKHTDSFLKGGEFLEDVPSEENFSLDGGGRLTDKFLFFAFLSTSQLN